MSILSEWIQLGKDNDKRPINYRKRQLYSMSWSSSINLSDCLVSSCANSGAIVMTRDPNKLIQLRGIDSSKQYVSIYSCSGNLISRFEWESDSKGQLIHVGWTSDECVVCVTSDAHVYIYDILSRGVRQFGFVNDVVDEGILKVVNWGSGVAILTNHYTLWVISDFNTTFCEQFAKIPVSMMNQDADLISVEVIPEDQSEMEELEFLVSVPQSKTMYFVSRNRCVDAKLTYGPFPRISVAPSGTALATLSSTGILRVSRVDFSTTYTELDIKSSTLPTQLKWCGEDCICLYWDPDQLGRDDTSLLLMMGPNGAQNSFSFNSPVHPLTEVDGLRIITNSTCEFLQRVPEPINEIHRAGSDAPGSTLYFAFSQFEKSGNTMINDITSIDLPEAVRTCYHAAETDFEHSLQRKYLRAASYGKSFCDDYYETSEFVHTCKLVRVLNAVRDYTIGMPLTSEQLERLTPQGLIERLLARMEHLLAFKISNYMDMKPTNVLVHWATTKVRSDEDEYDIFNSIIAKLKDYEDIPFSSIASAALRQGKKELALMLLEREERAADQVPLLLRMGEIKMALKQALNSGDSDLLYQVLLDMKKKMEPYIFFSIINEKGFEPARDLLVSYCREQDREFLETFYHALELPHEAATLSVLESFETTDLHTQRKHLNNAKELYSKRKDCYVDAKAADQQRQLLELQHTLDKTIGRKLFTGLSVSDTIFNLLLMGDKNEAKIKKDFNVPDKRYWNIKIAAYVRMGQWGALEEFSKKKSPIGYKPFAEACIQRGVESEAVKYIPRVTDPFEKTQLYVRVSKFKEAIEVAYGQRDVDLLLAIRAKASGQNLQIIDDLLAKLA